MMPANIGRRRGNLFARRFQAVFTKVTRAQIVQGKHFSQSNRLGYGNQFYRLGVAAGPRGSRYCAVHPPSIDIIAPVIERAASDAR